MKLRICSFDIEVVPLNIAQMPTPETCPIVLISNHFNYDYIINDSKTRNVVLILTKNVSGITEVRNDKIIVFFNDEKLLLDYQFQLMKVNDVIAGFNNNGFDIPYVIDRSRALGMKRINIGLGDSTLYYRKYLSKGLTITKTGGMVGKIIFDVLALLRREDESNVFKKKYNLKKQTLEHVSKEILGIEKLKFPIEKMVNYWINTDNIELRNEFIDYCSRDSELALLFVSRFRLLDKFFALSKASGKITQEIMSGMGSGSMVEASLLKDFRENDRLMSIRLHSSYKGKVEELSGAEVFEPILGISETVCSVDYKSLYPSLMIRHNLCYSTLIVDRKGIGLEKTLQELKLTENDIVVHTTEDGVLFARFVKPEIYKGIVPKKLEKLLFMRASQKKEMKKCEKGMSEYLMWDSSQNATKILLNSFYGYSGDSDAKVYSWDVATAVTTSGRKQIKKTWRMITEKIGLISINDRDYRLEIVQGDTDSSYLKIIVNDKLIINRDEAISVINYVLDKVNSTLQKPMSLDFENYIKRIVIVAKKRYAMLIVDDKGKETVVSKGIETIRRDWCNFATDNMSKVVDFILKEKDVNVGIEKSIELIKEQAKLLKKDKVDLNSLVLSNKLTKPIIDYNTKEAHIEVAIKMKLRGHPSEIGDRIEFIILDNGKKLISEKAEEASYVINNIDKFKIDKDYYLRSQLLSPLTGSPTRKGILELLGVKEEYILSKLDTAQKSLFDFNYL